MCLTKYKVNFVANEEIPCSLCKHKYQNGNFIMLNIKLKFQELLKNCYYVTLFV